MLRIYCSFAHPSEMAQSLLVAASVAATLIACMGGTVPQVSATERNSLIIINRWGPTSLPPFFKGKLGVARSSDYASLPSTIHYVSQLGSRVFCSLISFDQLTDRPRFNYALGRTRFTPDGVEADPTGSRWLQTLVQGLSLSHQNVYLALVGAPKPYQQTLIRKPAAHPTPTNIEAAARLTATWVRLALPSTSSINWVIWNEPEHTLRGISSSAAASDMAIIYRAYQNALSGSSPGDGFGLASFMKASLRDSIDSPGHSFASLVLQNLVHPVRPAIDFITLNNYRGGALELAARLDSDLRNAGMDQPLVLNQFAPATATLGIRPSKSGTTQAAGRYLDSLDRFVREPAIGSACMSFWAGPNRVSLLKDNSDGTFSPTLPFYALSLYQHLPLWRLPVQTADPDHPYTVWAARDATRLQVLVAPSLMTLNQGVPLANNSPTPGSNLSAREQRRRERQEGRLNKPLRINTGPLAPVTSQNTLHVLLKDSPDELVEVHRFKENASLPFTERLRTDPSGHLSLPVSSDQIVLLKLGTGLPLPPLLKAIRTDLYVHRSARQLGWASVDAIRDGFVLAMPSANAVAHASATYSIHKSDFVIKAQLITPQGGGSIRQALSCSALVLQGIKGERSMTLGSWGNLEAARQIHDSRAFAKGADQAVVTTSWPAQAAKGFVSLAVTSLRGSSLLRLHLAAEGCKPGTQLQFRVLS